MSATANASSYADCHGCSLCLLPCPMWRQHRDVSFSPQGFAKAMQAGATAMDLRPQLSSCIMCGACDVMCPENIDLTGMVSKAWEEAELPELPKLHQQADSAFQISCDPKVQAQLREDDLYIIDAAPFHAHHADRVEHYDRLRHQRGCSINLDLNRMAIPTGIGSVSADLNAFDVPEQIAWLLQGRSVARIIVENANGIEILSGLTGKPVIHIADLMQQGTGYA